MSNASNYLENLFANYFRATNVTGVDCYVALYNGDPGETGSGGVEVTSTVRTLGRLQVTFGAPSDGQISNTALIDFGASAGDTTITHVAIFDAATSGNLLVSRSVGNFSIFTGDEVRFQANNIRITIE